MQLNVLRSDTTSHQVSLGFHPSRHFWSVDEYPELGGGELEHGKAGSPVGVAVE
ncbi:MAG TPA: hypothetical protein VGO47_01875 [Chlamydiales bacterium]|nr:hypothetical protein [Chlamydiales bacterium]